MANLKDIRRRIKSVKNTQKITQAMRMVAAAKVKRAEQKVKAIRPYSQSLQEVLAQVAATLPDNAESPILTWLTPLAEGSQPKKPIIVVMSSDRGLCGSFNSSVVRQALKLEQHLLAQGITPSFITVGRKVTFALKRYGKSPILATLADMTAAPSLADARAIVQTASKAFLAGDADDVVVLSTHFRSLISYKVLLTSLVPGRLVPASCYLDYLLATPKAVDAAATPSGESLLEPSPLAVLEQAIPLYLVNQVYTLLLESAASELAARMTAMASATKNASEMIGKLTIQYNKVRQAAITQEILEIVSGAQALV